MKLILLGGNSIKNKDWIEKVEEQMSPLFDETHIQYYEHWSTEGAQIDIDKEIKTLAKTLAEEDEYIIFAKSIGCIIALRTIKEHHIKPESYLFTGFPLNFSLEHKLPIDQWVKNLDIDGIIIQNKDDPAGSSEKVDEFLIKNQVINYDMVELEGNTHDYENLDEITGFMEVLLS